MRDRESERRRQSMRACVRTYARVCACVYVCMCVTCSFCTQAYRTGFRRVVFVPLWSGRPVLWTHQPVGLLHPVRPAGQLQTSLLG